MKLSIIGVPLAFVICKLLEDVVPLFIDFGAVGVARVVQARVRQHLKLSPRAFATLDARTATSAELARYLRLDGCVCVENVFDDATREQVLAELTPHFETETRGIGGDEFGGGGANQTGRVGSIVLKSETSHKLALDRLVLGAVEDVLLPHTKKIGFKVMETIRMLPGGHGRQALHQEEGQWPIAKDWPVGSDYTVDVMFALSDFTAANGATHVIPGSNLWSGRGGKVDDSMPTIRAEMKKGSVFMFTGSLVHAGGSNHADDPRIGLVFGYQVGFLRPEANHVLSVQPDKAKDLPAPVQELLGYPLRYTPVSTPSKYKPGPGALAYRAAGAYAYNGAPDGHPSRLVPYAEFEEIHHSF